jgi:hypothetical protein
VIVCSRCGRSPAALRVLAEPAQAQQTHEPLQGDQLGPWRRAKDERDDVVLGPLDGVERGQSRRVPTLVR